MNIKFHYRYRGGANYKNNHFEILTNKKEIPVKEIEVAIRASLIDGEWFYVDKLGLKDLHTFTWNIEIDHTFHEFDSVEETNEEATKEDIAEFLALVESLKFVC